MLLVAWVGGGSSGHSMCSGSGQKRRTAIQKQVLRYAQDDNLKGKMMIQFSGEPNYYWMGWVQLVPPVGSNLTMLFSSEQ